MANPRQRRKARSKSHRPVSHSLHAKKKLKKTPPIRGPKLLQDAWDKHKTVRQNYARLGLVHRLNPLASGGVEPVEGRPSPAGTEMPMSKYGKIQRDEKGNVVGIIELEDEGEAEGNKDNSQWTEIGAGKGVAEKDHLLSALSSLSSSSSGPRHSSTLELNYLERLLHKHGLDLDKMAGDTKLNYEQRTVGQLRRGFKRVGLDV